jgi:membrane protease YdiL (CAAX protease family)
MVAMSDDARPAPEEGNKVLPWFFAFLLWGYIGTWIGRHVEAALPQDNGLVTAALVQQIVLAAVVYYMVRQYRPQIGRTLAIRELDWKNTVLIFLIALPLSRAADVLQQWTEIYLPFFDLKTVSRVQSALGSEETHAPWRDGIFVACLLRPIVDEVFFRGFLGRTLIARFGFGLGTISAAALFACLHVGAPGFTYALLTGVVFQFVYWTTQSLLAPILLHALISVFGFSWRLLPAETMLTPLAFAAGIALIYVAYRIRVQWRLPDGQSWQAALGIAQMPSPPTHAAPHTDRCPLVAGLMALGSYVAFLSLVGYDFYAFFLQNS